MKPTSALQQAMNDQVRKEFESAYIYLSMAAWMENQTLPGFAAWLRLQAREESAHALKIFDHLIDRGCRVRLQPLAGPATDFTTVLEVFEKVKHHMNKMSLEEKIGQLNLPSIGFDVTGPLLSKDVEAAMFLIGARRSCEIE